MKYLIVGAGFSGATIARELAEDGHTIHIIDKRHHIAGNAYDDVMFGIRYHKYGPHLFHTKNEKVYNYLSKFTTWIPYQHKVKAQLADGRYVTLPVNRETKNIVGEDNVLDIFFRPYTRKMWGMELEDLDPSIINRVPIRNDDNELYFPNDTYQYMPSDGYTKLIANMLDHSNISVELDRDFERSMEDNYDHVFNAMPIDEYYEFIHGELPYRSIKFHEKIIPMPKVLPTATVNFTTESPYTRVTEWKNIPGHGTNDILTLLTFEEPCDYKDNHMQRYYPVKDMSGKNREIYEKYKSIPNSKVTFIGRCGQYVYIDMDQAVNSALRIVMDFK
jgi:UDP-galactopyranose mutase